MATRRDWKPVTALDVDWRAVSAGQLKAIHERSVKHNIPSLLPEGYFDQLQPDEWFKLEAYAVLRHFNAESPDIEEWTFGPRFVHCILHRVSVPGLSQADAHKAIDVELKEYRLLPKLDDLNPFGYPLHPPTPCYMTEDQEPVE